MSTIGRHRRVISALAALAARAIVPLELQSVIRRLSAALLSTRPLRHARKAGIALTSVAVVAIASAPLAAAGGAGWAIQATPNPIGLSANILSAVSCPSAGACLAVGYHMTPNHGFSALAETWDGTSWRLVVPLQPASAAASLLGSVSCTSATDCTAVGYYRNSGGVFPLAERWNGTGWALQSPVAPAGSLATFLNGVSCMSATACMAVGTIDNSSTKSIQDLAEYWNGTTWAIQPTQAAFAKVDFTLGAVSCTSGTDCLAVGAYQSHFSSSPAYEPWAEHWNGSSWSGNVPDLEGSAANVLTGVSCTSATACTAIGYYENTSSLTKGLPLAERWNGAGWTLQYPPVPLSSIGYGSHFDGVSCASATACTAVGSYNDATGRTLTLGESWDGTSWSLGSTANPALATQSALYGVSCVSPAVCTAVGEWDAWTPTTTGFYPIYTLGERHS